MIVNDIEMIFLGLRRSGNHAVINWLAGHFDVPVWFVNNIDSFDNPTVRQRDWPGMYFKPLYNSPVGVGNFWNMKKGILFHSYEDIDLNNLNFESNRSVVGESSKFFVVLIVRDPFNLFASRLTKYYTGSIITATPSDMQLWKQHAREAVGIRNTLPNKVVVNFDRWVISETYRRQIETELGLGISDAWMDKMAGIGSSFDAGMDRDARKLSLSDRWKKQLDNPSFLCLIDTEVIELHKTLFGDVPIEIMERVV